MSTPEPIELDFPIDVNTDGGGTLHVTSVTLRRMKAKDLKHLNREAIAEQDPAALLPLIAALTDLPLEAVEELDMVDIKKMVDTLMTFSAGFLGTGTKSSGESPEPTTSLLE